MGLLARTVVSIPLLVFFTMMSWISWTLIDPIAAETILDDSNATTFAEPVLLVISLVFRFAFPGLALVVVIWWVFGAIHTDSHHHTHVRGGPR